MKCEYCNGDLSLEDEYCPHCGQPNKHAKKHIDDMRKYQGEFEDTKRYVREKTTGYTEIAVRVVILSVLIVLILVFFAVGSNAWEINRQIRKSSAKRNYEEYSRMMDEYLAEGDFLKFYSFCEHMGIRSYDSVYEEKYGNIINACSWYKSVYELLYDFAGFDADDSVSHVTEMTGDALDSFYKYYRNDDFSYTGRDGESELYRKTLDDMERNIELILSTYCGLTKEEAAAFPEMSKAKRDILLEEKLEEKLQNEQ